MAIVVTALVLALAWVTFGGAFFGPNAFVLALVTSAAVGGLVGWMTEARLPRWIAPALGVSGMVLVLMGFSQYNDDGPSGPLFGPLALAGVAALPMAALLAGLSAGSDLRRTQER